MTPKASMTHRLCGLAISLAITTSALAQTVTAVGDNRSGSLYASDGVGDASVGTYAITPRTFLAPIDFVQSFNDGGATASLDSHSHWLDLGAGNETTGFVGFATLAVGLGANAGNCQATDHAQVSLWINGLVGGQTMAFDFHGAVTNTFSSGSVHLVGPEVNITYGSQSEWNQVLQLQNGVYTLTIDASSSLLGIGPDAGGVEYTVVLRRIPASPPNDTCDAPITISEGTTPISVVNATGATGGPISCTGTDGDWIYRDVFYRYVATANGIATVSTCGTVDWNTRLAAFSGSCAAPVFLACNDDACGAQSTIQFPTVCGETYTIVLGGDSPEPVGSGTGTMTLTQSGGCFSANACDLAFPVYQGDNNVANWYDWASDIVLPAWCALGGDSTIHRGTFWTWTAPTSGPVVISTCGTVDAPVDSRIAVFVGSCDSPQWIGCNDNACGVFSTIGFYAFCGQEYTIAVGSANGAIGTWNLSVTQSGAPCNDQCSGATSVTVGANPVTNIGATGLTITPNGCGGAAMVIANDVFYTYTATATGTATVSTCGGVNFDSRLGVFTGSCAAPNWVACNDDGDGCHLFSSSLSFEAVCGQVYTIVLGNNPDNFGPGSGNLVITQQGSCPDTCQEAAPLSLGTNQVSTLGMTGVTLLPAGCNEGYGTAIYNDAFFTYDATADGIVTIATCGPGTDFDTRLAAFAGTCDALELLACNDDGLPCGFAAQISFPTICGRRYVIVLGSFNGQMGHATLHVSQTGMCRPNCLGDLNQNGSVGAEDIAILLGQWGGPGNGDLTGNGQVLSDDLAILLGAWGNCP